MYDNKRVSTSHHFLNVSFVTLDSSGINDSSFLALIESVDILVKISVASLEAIAFYIWMACPWNDKRLHSVYAVSCHERKICRCQTYLVLNPIIYIYIYIYIRSYLLKRSESGWAYQPRQQGLWGQHEAHLGPAGPRWAPCWPHKFYSHGHHRSIQYWLNLMSESTADFRVVALGITVEYNALKLEFWVCKHAPHKLKCQWCSLRAYRQNSKDMPTKHFLGPKLVKLIETMFYHEVLSLISQYRDWQCLRAEYVVCHHMKHDDSVW